MAMRIRSQWRKSQKPVTLEDNAVALAYNIWQVALTSAKNLHAEDFEYKTDDQRVAVITEYLCFLVHVADRLAFATLDEDQRRRYVLTLANETARHRQRNVEDIMGSGDYRGPYIALFNERSTDYADTSFVDAAPGYDMLRYFGHQIQKIMGTGPINRWAIDQIMEIDAPAAVDNVRKSFEQLFATADALKT